ncbi:hypothetical protein BpHYR1_020213 [Brachionus plicatilis]|uniref:Uncharacterized protein n=1 Tax=Brachionus plicatilis TaxID=10195 RepID=A0A3M7RIL1_BRAPC|nr:hypothetical protein BpHYR1_020213 [Brachionus plicatilis]
MFLIQFLGQQKLHRHDHPSISSLWKTFVWHELFPKPGDQLLPSVKDKKILKNSQCSILPKYGKIDSLLEIHDKIFQIKNYENDGKYLQWRIDGITLAKSRTGSRLSMHVTRFNLPRFKFICSGNVNLANFLLKLKFLQRITLSKGCVTSQNKLNLVIILDYIFCINNYHHQDFIFHLKIFYKLSLELQHSVISSLLAFKFNPESKIIPIENLIIANKNHKKAKNFKLENFNLHEKNHEKSSIT